MEKEIKITLVPKEQIGKEYDNICITCGNICAWGNCLEVAIKAFDEALRQHRWTKLLLGSDWCRQSYWLSVFA